MTNLSGSLNIKVTLIFIGGLRSGLENITHFKLMLAQAVGFYLVKCKKKVKKAEKWRREVKKL